MASLLALSDARAWDECLARVASATAADVSERSALGCTALHYAAADGRVELVDALLRRGADPNAAAAEGDTPLMCAASNGHADAAAALLARGAGVDRSDAHGATALVQAAELGRAAVCRLLLAWGADPRGAERGADAGGLQRLLRDAHRDAPLVLRCVWTIRRHSACYDARALCHSLPRDLWAALARCDWARPFVLLLSGPTGSGKSAVAAALRAAATRRPVVVVQQDEHYDPASVPTEADVARAGCPDAAAAWEDPDRIRWAAVDAAIGAAPPNALVIVEGCFVLSAAASRHGLARRADAAVTLDVPQAVSLARRRARDPWLRRHPAHHARYAWPAYVGQRGPGDPWWDDGRHVVVDARPPLEDVVRAVAQAAAPVMTM